MPQTAIARGDTDPTATVHPARTQRPTVDVSMTDRSAVEARLAAGRDRFVDGLEDAREAADHQAWLAHLIARQQFDRVDDTLGLGERLGEDTRVYAAIEGAFTQVVSAAVTLLIGIYVFAQISNSMPTPENAALNNSMDTVMTTTGDAFTLGAVAVIVLVASVILALVGGFGGGGMGRR